MKKYASNFSGSIPAPLFLWANSQECVISLSGVNVLHGYGFTLDQIKLWNKAAIAGNTKGIRGLLAPSVKLSYRACGKHGKTYGLYEFRGDVMIRDSAVFLEAQIK